MKRGEALHPIQGLPSFANFGAAFDEVLLEVGEADVHYAFLSPTLWHAVAMERWKTFHAVALTARTPSKLMAGVSWTRAEKKKNSSKAARLFRSADSDRSPCAEQDMFLHRTLLQQRSSSIGSLPRGTSKTLLTARPQRRTGREFLPQLPRVAQNWCITRPTWRRRRSAWPGYVWIA